ncbi:TonB-dependent copper receptor [Pelagicoccus sp. SDUM812003]|uniref:TonB-dependent copper receptor n=1 Tax=Pelagicoccus sp. SDUM812003 TaxID=3041267 RepID=UPI00280CB153|nr:TonB-dependent copper receptor [Pelagicoccus sp. SDUM812003]MDQ8204169.1 TonB-dependent copper receptor [Pelagicoccus sp. SDUM812003]
MNIFHSRPFNRATLAYLALFPNVLSAAESASEPETPVVELQPVVVTIPESVHPLELTLDAKAPVQPLPAQDGADLLKSVPGFSVVRKGGTDGDPVLRGMAGSRLVIAVEGQPIYGGCGYRMDPPTAYVFPAAYDTVTILKGPQTVAQGPGNSAGVVRFESRHERPSENSLSGEAHLLAGSFGRRDLAAAASAESPRFFSRVTLNRADSDDYEDGSGQAVHSEHMRWNANLSFGWTPDEDSLLQVGLTRSDGEAAYADRAMDGVRFDRESLTLRFRKESLSDTLRSVELEYGYNYVDHVMDNYSLRSFSPNMMMPNPTVSNPDRRTQGGKVSARLEPSNRLELLIGADAQSNDHSIRGSMNQERMPYQTQVRMKDAQFEQWGLFAESRYALGETDTLAAGVRVDRWRAEDLRSSVNLSMMSMAPNPTSGLKRETTLGSGFLRYERERETGQFYAGVGSVERFPDYWELVRYESESDVSGFETDPERTVQVDVGYVYSKGRIRYSIAGFYSEIDDFILIESGVLKTSAGGGARAATVVRNIDAKTVGGEASAVWRIDEFWKADASLAYVRGRNLSDDLPLAQMPPLEARLGLSYTRRNWSIGSLWRIVSSQERVAVGQGSIVGQDIGPSDAFDVFSLNASWYFTDHARVSLGIDNVYDSEYSEHISRAGSAVAGYWQTLRVNEPGRQLWARVDTRF